MIEQLTHLINNVGFPIVACLFMFHQNIKLTEALGELRNTLSIIDKRIEMIEKEVFDVEDK